MVRTGFLEGGKLGYWGVEKDNKITKDNDPLRHSARLLSRACKLKEFSQNLEDFGSIGNFPT